MGALLIVAVGNYLGKTGRNSFVGVRTYWSLSSDYVWEKSNRATGRMLVAAGLLELGAIAGASIPVVARICLVPEAS